MYIIHKECSILYYYEGVFSVSHLPEISLRLRRRLIARQVLRFLFFMKRRKYRREWCEIMVMKCYRSALIEVWMRNLSSPDFSRLFVGVFDPDHHTWVDHPVSAGTPELSNSQECHMWTSGLLSWAPPCVWLAIWPVTSFHSSPKIRFVVLQISSS